MFNMGTIGTFFLISLGITFVLCFLLVYHFKNRISFFEKKSDVIVDIINNITNEIRSLKRQWGGESKGNTAVSLGPPIPSMKGTFVASPENINLKWREEQKKQEKIKEVEEEDEDEDEEENETDEEEEEETEKKEVQKKIKNGIKDNFERVDKETLEVESEELLEIPPPSTNEIQDILDILDISPYQEQQYVNDYTEIEECDLNSMLPNSIQIESKFQKIQNEKDEIAGQILENEKFQHILHALEQTLGAHHHSNAFMDFSMMHNEFNTMSPIQMVMMSHESHAQPKFDYSHEIEELEDVTQLDNLDNGISDSFQQQQEESEKKHLNIIDIEDDARTEDTEKISVTEKSGYSKMNVTALRSLVAEKGLCEDSSKLKKKDLLKLLQSRESISIID